MNLTSTFTNNGTFVSAYSSTLKVTGFLTQNVAASLTGTIILDGTINGTGSLSVVIRLLCGGFYASAGTGTLAIPTNITNGAALALDSGTNGSAGLTLLSNVTCDGAIIYHAADTASNPSFISIAAGKTLTVNSTFTMTTDSNATLPASITNTGTLAIGSTGSLSSTDAINPAASHNVSATVVNAGQITSSSGVLAFLAGFTQASGSLTLNGGNLSTVSALAIQGGQFGGGGGGGTSTITGDVNNSGGILQVSPSGLFGKIHITGSYSQGAAPASLNVNIGGTTAGTQYDQVIVDSPVTFAAAAAAQISTIDFAPATSDNFTVMTYPSNTGTLATHTAVPAVNADTLTTGATTVVYNVSSFGNPIPTLASISPATGLLNTANFGNMTLTGTNFMSTSHVRWSGQADLTSFVSQTSTQIVVTIPDSYLTSPGAPTVRLFNPATGGGNSNAKTFVLTYPVPTVTSVSPTTVNANSASYSMIVNGTNFVGPTQVGGAPISNVSIAGSPSFTTFISSTQLSASVHSTDITTTGDKAVTVVNAAPGGGTSVENVFFTVVNPTPALTLLSPDTVSAGAGLFTLTLTGTSFISGTVVNFQGQADLTPTSFSASQITVDIPAAYTNAGGTPSIHVTSPAPGGGQSLGKVLTVNNPFPNLTGISPTAVAAGGTGFTLTATGSSFVSSAVLDWPGHVSLSAATASSTQLTFSVPAAYIADGGLPSLTVTNPTPIGGTSATQVFTINNPLPVLASLNPSQATAGSGGFSLVLSGSGFVPSSVVNWQGQADLTPASVTSTQITVNVPASYVASAATPTITVTNPTPSGGVSQPQNFTVNNPNPVPTLTLIAPNSAFAGTTGFGNVTLTGTNFLPTSVVKWSGQADLTTLASQSATQIVVAVPDSYLAASATPTISVFNPTPGGGTSGTQSFTITNAAPTITTLSPTSAIVNTGAFTLTVNGTGFAGVSVVNVNGSPRTTTFVSNTQLTAAILAADIASTGPVSITVVNPAPGGGTSAAATLSVVNPVPTLTVIAPNSAFAGTTGFGNVTLTGTNFLATSVIKWSGQADLTTLASHSATQIVVTVPDSYLAASGAPTISVFNPTPGGGASGTQPFTIANAAPTITTLSPTTVIVNTGAFTLTVNGTGFANVSVVNVNGSPRTTTFVSNTQLTAAILAADIATTGPVNITVVNPAPGGGASAAATLSVVNPVPTLTGIAPNSAFAGTTGFGNVTLTGTNFLATSVVKWSGKADLTTLASQSATQIVVAVPDSYLTASGTPTISVFNPVPGGGTSATQVFTINTSVAAPVPPSITSVLTASATIGAAFNYTITATGTAPVTFAATNLPAGLSLSGAVISGTPTVGGVASIELKASNAAGTDSHVLILTIAQPAGTFNAPPVFPSAPSITPNPVEAGSPAAFLATASDANNDLLSYNWDFGDGTNQAGAAVSHVYSAPGIYLAAITVSDGTNTTIHSQNVAVNPAEAGSGGTPDSFIVTKVGIKFNFASAGADSIGLMGSFPVAAGTKFSGVLLSVAIDKLTSRFALDAGGKGLAGAASIKVSAKAKKGVVIAGPAKFAYSLKKSALQAQFGDLGFSNSTIGKPGVRIEVPVIFTVSGHAYIATPTVTYSATRGKSGSAK